ncbi:MAG: M48 family metallopeptidase, partial [Chloroflexi bacterium]|nr:M48 family metallopeptidase [Chloroflexota bacterium]
MADIFFPMMPTPDWVRELSHRVLDDAAYGRHCTIEWRWGDPRPKSWAEPARGRVVIRAPRDRGHAALASTLLHELAHLVMPLKEHHSRRFWRHFYGLVERYGSGGDCSLSAEDAYVLSRHYKVTAIKVAAELGVRAARSDLAERVPGAAQPRRWLDETLALERRLVEQTCEACLEDVVAAPSGARNPTAPAFNLAPSALRERAGGEGLRAW